MNTIINKENNLSTKIHNALLLCHPDDNIVIELDYYELSKIYSTLKAQELYDATLEKCLMDGFDKVDNTISIEKDNDIKTLNDKFFKRVDKSIEDKLTLKYGEVTQ